MGDTWSITDMFRTVKQNINKFVYIFFLESLAYQRIRQPNQQLKGKGFITIAGRGNRQYFNERLYGARKEVNENAGI